MLKEGYEKVNFLALYVRFSNLTNDVFRQNRVYSKLPIFGDGWCWPPDLS